ncbi:mannan endo-1,4-beta-mannosidase [Saccharothrix saharensis]|uniref:Mannan endo-1,4-beta-mannosidase n=1 Tax=Saccharothrix saharensis TaxID=571190 RepID=A0A543JIS3_9PSEU|nr:glycosyl hydrolase [Saccharothrix saharensis]TQM82651.1 mannan endo-1,4-beta-mannosidase [Saccharothrix saharensis]
MRTAMTLVALLLTTLVPPAAAAAPPPIPVVDYLKRITGTRTVTGMHNKEPNSDPARHTAKVHAITGVYPGLWGGDFLFAQDDVAHRQTMVDQAKTEWRNGSLVTLTWHVCPPTRPTSCGWDAGVNDDLTDAQWSQLVTDGTALNNAWKARLDEVVPFLRQLLDAGVQPLFRPLHEMNDGWSWWGGRPGANGSRRLYQLTHDHLVRTRGLTGMAWVWNVKDLDPAGIAAYYPGPAYTDVVSLDAWNSFWPSATYYDTLRSLAQGKPLALAEVGRVPSPGELASQPEWAYFMAWPEFFDDKQLNPDSAVRATYASPRAVNQGQLTGGGGNLALGRPSWSTATESAAHPSSHAFDGNPATRWSSAFTDQHSLWVDLGSTKPVRRVRLDWEAAHARQYQLQTSTDGTTWTTVHADYAADGGTDEIVLDTSARYVKLYAFQRATPYGYSLWEMSVY